MTEGNEAIRVTVLDEPFAIRSEAQPDYTRRVAAHVDATLRALRQGAPTLDPFPTAVLGAMEITNDLFRARGDAAALADEVVARVETLADAIDQALEGEDSIREDKAR